MTNTLKIRIVIEFYAHWYAFWVLLSLTDSYQQHGPKVQDLYCGAGLFSCGLAMAGMPLLYNFSDANDNSRV